MSRLSRPRYQRRKTRGFTTRDVGDEIRRAISRGQYRRELATGVSTKFNGVTLDSYSYSYDALSRPTTRNSDAFGYNERSEVVSAQIGTNQFAHAYDCIGNQTNFVANAATNSYAHNALNQISTATIPPLYTLNSPLSISHDLDGNMTSDNIFAYSYDAENRLSSVSPASLTNGAVRVVNAYDCRNRRTAKTVQRYADSNWQTIELHSFVYDNWNLIHETVVTISGATTNVTEIQYFWGADLSNTLQGARGVGGLLAVSRNGDFYLPAYDNNWNIRRFRMFLVWTVATTAVALVIVIALGVWWIREERRRPVGRPAAEIDDSPESEFSIPGGIE